MTGGKVARQTQVDLQGSLADRHLCLLSREVKLLQQTLHLLGA